MGSHDGQGGLTSRRPHDVEASGSRLRRWIMAGWAAGACLFAADVGRLISRAAGTVTFTDLLHASGILFGQLLLLGVALALGLWILVKALSAWPFGPGRAWGMRALPFLLVGLSTLPLWELWSDEILRGPRARGASWTEGARGLLLLVGSTGTAALLRMLVLAERPGRSPNRRTLLGVLLVLFGIALDQTDGLLYRGQYPLSHHVVALSAAIVLTGAWCFWAPWSSARREFLVHVGMALALIFGTAVIWGLPPTPSSEFLLVRKTLHGQRLRTLQQAFLPTSISRGLATPLAEATITRRPLGSSKHLARLDRRSDWSVLWISIDTLRADHVSCYGYGRPTTRRLDAFAHDAVLFERAYAQFPITNYSFQSMFYGRYPSATPLYRLMKRAGEPVPGLRTVAEIMRDHGVATVALPAIPSRELTEPGCRVMTTGFSEVNPGQETSDRTALGQTRAAVQCLKRFANRRFFMWVHLFEPHHPYETHPGSAFGTSTLDRYDSEIAHCDAQVGVLLEALKAEGLDSKTVVVINADHGEALGDHATDFHGSTLYDEQIRIPLLVKVPGVSGKRVRTLVENVDIAPTLLELLDIQETVAFQGESLLDLLVAGDPETEDLGAFAYAELPDTVNELSPSAQNRQAVIQGPWKLIFDGTEGIHELYDVVADPGERRNLAQDRPAEVERLLALALALRRDCEDLMGSPRAAQALELDRLRRRLLSGTSLERLALFHRALEQDLPGIDALLSEVLADTSTPLDATASLVRLAAPRLGRGVLPSCERALSACPRLSFGSLQSVFAALHHVPPPLPGEILGVLRASLESPFEVAHAAAGLLARDGDATGAGVLSRGLLSPDWEFRLTSAWGLGHLERPEAAPHLRSALSVLARDPVRCVRTLQALATLRDVGAVSFVTSLVEETFLAHEIKLAALSYLERIGGPDVVPAYLLLLNGWDPGVTRAVLQSAERVTQGLGVRDLRSAALLFSSARDLAAQGEAEAALEELGRVILALSERNAPAHLHLMGARWAYAAKNAEAMRVHAEAFEAWAKTAEDRAALLGLRETEEGSKEARVTILETEPLQRGVLRCLGATAHRVRLRNLGPARVLGGRWSGGARVTIEWSDGDAPLDVTSYPAWLPQRGLGVGEECTVGVWCSNPKVPGLHTSRLRVVSPSSAITVEPSLADSRSVRVFGLEGTAEVDPTLVVFRGRSLLEQWISSPSLVPVSVLPDGPVTWALLDPDSGWFVSPPFRDLGRALEITMSYRLFSPSSSKDVAACHVAYGSEPGGFAGPPISGEVSADGATLKIPVLLEPSGGRGARFVRLHPCRGAHLMVIDEIRVQAR